MMHTKKSFSAALLSLVLFFGFGTVVFVHAQCQGTPPPAGCNTTPPPAGTNTTAPSTNVSGTIPNPFTAGGTNPTLPDLLRAIFNNILLPIGSVLAVMAFIWTGFKYVMASGNPKKIEEANMALLYTVIGTAVLLGATLISDVLKNTLESIK